MQTDKTHIKIRHAIYKSDSISCCVRQLAEFLQRLCTPIVQYLFVNNTLPGKPVNQPFFIYAERVLR